MVALDGSKEAEAVLPYVEPFALAFGASVTFVCPVVPVVETVAGQMALTEGGLAPGMVGAMESLRETLANQQASYLASLAERWAARGIAVTCEEPWGRPAEVIVQVAREKHAELVAMAIPGHGEIRHDDWASAAREVTRTAPCTVLLVRP